MAEEEKPNEAPILTEYTEDHIRHLSDMEHIRTRPGMYIGKLGDGSHAEDGIYVLLKEVMDNSIDEFKMNAGRRIEITVEDNLRVSVRDYGRGIPLGKLIEAVSMLNTGGKYDSKAFKKSVGLNGVGVKAVNALSSHFEVRSHRDGEMRRATFERGILTDESTEPTADENGTFIYFEPDSALFKNYTFRSEFIETMLRNYTYLNTGLTIMFNGRRIHSRNGLVDLLNDNMTNDGLYPIIHLKGEDIEIAFTHTGQYGEEYYSFVNGQHTTQGGTHQSAFKKHIAETIKDFSGKNFDYGDIRNGLVAAIAINIEEPLFESQTKIKLGSLTTIPDGGISIDKFVGDFVKEQVDNYLHKNTDIADIIIQKITENEKERKAIAGETGTRTGQKGQSAQPQATRLPHPPERCQRRLEGGQQHLHHRRRLGQRQYHQEPRRDDPSGIQSARQAVELFRPHEESGVRKRGVQPPASRPEHRRRTGRTTL